MAYLQFELMKFKYFIYVIEYMYDIFLCIHESYNSIRFTIQKLAFQVTVQITI